MQGGGQPPLPDIPPPQKAMEAVEDEGDKVRPKGIRDDQSAAQVAEPAQKAREDYDPRGYVDHFPADVLGI